MSYQDPYAPQDVYAQQQQLGNGDPYSTQPAQQYAQPGVYPQPAQPNYVQLAMRRGGNPWANGAMYSGIISIILALLTLFSQIGYAGLITGSFAIYRGIVALNRAKKLPGNPGRIQATLGLVLGLVALVLVFASFALRGNGS